MTAQRLARQNPFRVNRVLSLRYRLDALGWRDLLDRWAELGQRAALVGPKGSGKTTLLEELEQRLEARGWHLVPLRLRHDRRRLNAADWRRLQDAGPRHLVTVDGVEQLSWWRWHQLSKHSQRAGGLIVTSHTPGRLPTLRRHQTDPSLLHALVTELVGTAQAARLAPELEQLFEQHQGNLRDCLRSLYDAWAGGTHRWPGEVDSRREADSRRNAA